VVAGAAVGGDAVEGREVVEEGESWSLSLVVSSTTSKIRDTITMLAATTGTMYLEYHLKGKQMLCANVILIKSKLS